MCVILVPVSMPVWTVGNIRFGRRGGEGGGKSVGKGDPLSDVDDRRSDNEIKSPLGHERLGGD